jgi:hypothetical protein
MPRPELKIVLPLILALTCAADGVTRALPVGFFSFRAWEALAANGPADAPFEPAARYDSTRSFGDLANLGNIRRMRIYRHETFTTDAYGFRNPPGLAESGTSRLLLIGDSFAAGSGVSDELTLAGQLAATWKLPTYTVAPAVPSAGSLPALVRMLKMKPGSWVVHQQTYLYTEADAQILGATRHPSVSPIGRFLKSFDSDVRPIGILIERARKTVQDGVLFPNPFSSTVRLARLQNGDEMLFLAKEEVPDSVAPAIAATVADSVRYAKGLSDAATRLGLKYLAVLMPVKAAVYGHLLTPPVTDAPRVPAITAETERQLLAEGLRVVNLFEPLTSVATERAARHQYVYWRDDTHWNPLGISVAARAIAAAIGEERTRGR